jgi:surface protein
MKRTVGIALFVFVALTALGAQVYGPADFVTVWKTVAPDQEVALPLVEPGDYEYQNMRYGGITVVVAALPSDFRVVWGDGTIGRVTPDDYSGARHVYAEPGEYEVIISGTIGDWSFQPNPNDRGTVTGNPEALREIRQWGSFNFGTLGAQFLGCFNMRVSATDVPDLSETTNFNRAFASELVEESALTEIPGIETWDVSNVEIFTRMFMGAGNFDADLSRWDMSGATDLGWMFMGAEEFTSDLSSWDVSGVEFLGATFWGAKSFTSDLSAWDVSNVTSAGLLFYGAEKFDSDLNEWDVSNITDMRWMFYRAKNFDGDISGWDVSSVTKMGWMFYEAESFTGDISRWDVSNVEMMTAMFQGASSFSGDLSAWDVSGVSDVRGIFRGSGLEGNEPAWYFD